MQSTQRLIEQSVENGEKNRRTARLVHNWCAHVQIERLGGRGYVEALTGLPIGHHSLSCPHAPARGMATSDLADAALDFYDRNCVSCKQRKPVGLPNISELIAERDKKNQERKKRTDDAQAALALQLEARNAARVKLRQKLSHASATVLELVQDVDHHASDANVAKLIETARLAKEHFSPAIRDHMFELAAIATGACRSACLRTLEALGDDRERLCAIALKAAADRVAVQHCAEIIAACGDCADANLVAAAVPALIDEANPRFESFGRGRREGRPAALMALYDTHRMQVLSAIQDMLTSRSAHVIDAAARGISALAAADATVCRQFARELIAKLTRAKHLLPDLDHHDYQSEANIRNVIVNAFIRDTAAIDDLLQNFFAGADDEGGAAVVGIYAAVLRTYRRETRVWDGTIKIAFRHLLSVATTSDTPEVFEALQSGLSGLHHSDAGLASSEIEPLLGAAAVLDEKLRAVLAAPNVSHLDRRPAIEIAMERDGKARSFSRLRDIFAGLACRVAAAGTDKDCENVVHFIDQLPEVADDLKATLVGHLHEIAVNTDKFSIVLPALYRAMVGASVLQRGLAASSIGELDHRHIEDAPALLLETFVVLLGDTYVFVHRTALEALSRISIPESLMPQVEMRLRSLLRCYANQPRGDSRNDSALLKCIKLLGDRFPDRYRYDGWFGDCVMPLLKACGPLEITEDVRFWSWRFSKHRDLPGLLIHLWEASERGQLHREQLWDCINGLSRDQVGANLETLTNFGLREAVKQFGASSLVVDLLSRAGAWPEAVKVSAAAVQATPEDVRNRATKLERELVRIACQIEFAVAEGRADQITGLARSWREAMAAYKTDEQQHAQQRQPFRGLLGQA